ncbi:hypothetical protein VTL71DRAFT_14184 [Oculimacula yallundae]|uniref:RING-type domain-containing protein n=1 Tax=Oculimacula yallundae TaxID=86028 RepID=A0ABR4CIF2_9HELO
MASRIPKPRGKDTTFKDIQSFRQDFVNSTVLNTGFCTTGQLSAISDIRRQNIFYDPMADNCVFKDVRGYRTYNKDTGPKSTLLRGPMLHAPEQEIECSDRLKVVIRSVETIAKTFPADHPVKAQLDALFGLWTTICSLKQIDRYLSSQQPPLLEVPDANGRNLGYSIANPRNHTAFATEDDLQKLTITLLHAPGLIRLDYDPANPPINNVGMDGLGVLALKDLYLVGRLLLQEELNRAKPDADDDFPRALFNTQSKWVRGIRKNVLNALEGVATLACYRPDPTEAELRRYIRDMRKERAEAGLRPLTEEEEEEEVELELKYAREKTFQERLDANFEEKGFNLLGGLEKDLIERLTVENHLDPLIMDLVRREDEFEAALALEHYEDKLINKQVSVLAEEQITQVRPWEPRLTVKGLNGSFEREEDGTLKNAEDEVYKYLQDMGLVNRHRRDFRLLRDWMGKRPCCQQSDMKRLGCTSENQIYQLYNCKNKAEPMWVEEGIKLFDQKVFTQFIDTNFSLPITPTALSNILPRIFGFLPIDTDALYSQSFSRDSCTLCSKSLYNEEARPIRGFSNTVVELYCSSQHKFHLKCIFTYWDSPGKYLHSCPQCGEMAKLNYQIAGLSPTHGHFVHNNQNYKTAANMAMYLDPDIPVHETLARKARELYDVPEVPLSPRQGDPMVIDTVPPPSTYAGMAYYESEVSRRAALLAMPVTWEGAIIKAGVKASEIFTPSTLQAPRTIATGEETYLSLEEINQRQVIQRYNQPREAARRIAKTTGNMFLKREFERGNRDVYDVDSARVLPAARLAPSMEAGFLRSARRRRAHKLRERIKKEGRGLGGL